MQASNLHVMSPCQSLSLTLALNPAWSAGSLMPRGFVGASHVDLGTSAPSAVPHTDHLTASREHPGAGANRGQGNAKRQPPGPANSGKGPQPH